eukprot:6491016-Amphidinium_carterae.1
MKKTSVTLMKDSGISSAVVSAVTCTSVRVVDQVYDVPTCKRQRLAIDRAFRPVLQNLQDNDERAFQPGGETHKSSTSTSSLRFCTACGYQRANDTWVYCPRCGAMLVH